MKSRRGLVLESLENRQLLAAEISVAVEQPPVIAENDAGTLTYTLSRPAGDSSDYLTVKFELNGTAAYEDDYRIRDSDVVNNPETGPAAGAVVATATFEPGESEVDVRVDPRTDTIDEVDETVILSVVDSDVFGTVTSAAALRVVDQDPVFYVVDEANQLATVDVEIGCVHVIGTMQGIQDITDIAFTADGTLFAISAQRLYQVDYENPVLGDVTVTDLGTHGIIGANALVDSRDGDFGSETGDLFAAGTNALDLFRIDVQDIAGALTITGVTNVFDVDAALENILITKNYVTSGDLDYARGDLVLAAVGDSDAFDSLIRIETPGSAGVVTTAPVPAEDFNEDFLNIDGLAIGNNSLGFGFSGHTLLSVDTRSLNASRELELTGRAYDLGVPDTVTGTIEGNLAKTVVINTDDSGPGSLRSAILFANGEPGTQTIEFAIPGPGPHVISPLTQLPVISDAVTIDGTSEPDYLGTPVIQIDANDTLADAFVVRSTGTTITGLSITGFTDAGVLLFSGGSSAVANNYIGIDPSGVPAGNFIGVKVIQSAGNEIADNVVSGNTNKGIFVNGVRATGNLIDGNMIGTDPAGTTGIPNLRDGIALWAPGNTVNDNVISGNAGSGVVTRLATGGDNTISNNLIGVDLTGTASLANTVGVLLRSPRNSVSDNTISGNTHGVIMTGGDANLNIVTGNMIGTDPSGTSDLGNDVYGVGIIASERNAIGGPAAGQENVISGNGFDGVIISRVTAKRNFVQNNRIGVNAVGTAGIPNEGDGVRIVQRVSDNIVRVNQISGNGRRGVSIEGSGTSGNTVVGNRIGTNATGSSSLHNANPVGVLLTGPGNEITQNVISAVDTAIASFSAFATDNVISNNDIGSNPALATPDGIHLLGGSVGTSVTGNTVANGQRGIIVSGAATRNDLSRNVIFGNSQIGIDLGADGATANDPADVDGGPNLLQNTPRIIAAVAVSKNLRVTYSVNSLRSIVNYPIRVEFFASGDNQARVLLGTDLYTGADRAAGEKTITLNNVTTLLESGDRVTATATDADGNSSELSLGIAITAN